METEASSPAVKQLIINDLGVHLSTCGDSTLNDPELIRSNYIASTATEKKKDSYYNLQRKKGERKPSSVQKDDDRYRSYSDQREELRQQLNEEVKRLTTVEEEDYG